MRCDCGLPTIRYTALAGLNEGRHAQCCPSRKYSRSRIQRKPCNFLVYEDTVIVIDDEEPDPARARTPETTGRKIPRMPPHITAELYDMASRLGEDIECVVCLNGVKYGKLVVTACGHKYCKSCVDMLDAVGRACPVCKN